MRSGRLIAIGGAIVGIVVFVAVLKHRDATNASRAHDPAKPRRQRIEYHEKLNGTRYTNDDLKLSLAAPEGWSGALGARPEFADLPYEGLIVKFEKPGALPNRPLLSLVLRREGREAGATEVEYATKHLLGPGKTLVGAPRSETLFSRPSCRLDYDLVTGAGSLRIRQYVLFLDKGALVVSAMSDLESSAALAAEFDAIVRSLKLET